jgi:hypothetical protein
MTGTFPSIARIIEIADSVQLDAGIAGMRLRDN